MQFGVLSFKILSVENMQSPKVKTVRKFNFIRKKRLGTRILLIKDASMAFVICTTAERRQGNLWLKFTLFAEVKL